MIVFNNNKLWSYAAILKLQSWSPSFLTASLKLMRFPYLMVYLKPGLYNLSILLRSSNDFFIPRWMIISTQFKWFRSSSPPVWKWYPHPWKKLLSCGGAPKSAPKFYFPFQLCPGSPKSKFLPPSSKESFAWISLKTMICLVLDFEGMYLYRIFRHHSEKTQSKGGLSVWLSDGYDERHCFRRKWYCWWRLTRTSHSGMFWIGDL